MIINSYWPMPERGDYNGCSSAAKSASSLLDYVVAKATTYKDSRVVKLSQRVRLSRQGWRTEVRGYNGHVNRNVNCHVNCHVNRHVNRHVEGHFSGARTLQCGSRGSGA